MSSNETWQQAAIKEYAGKFSILNPFAWGKKKGVDKMPMVKSQPQQSEDLSYDEAMKQFNEAQEKLNKAKMAMPPPPQPQVHKAPQVQQTVAEPPKVKVTYMNQQGQQVTSNKPLPETEELPPDYNVEEQQPQEEAEPQQQVTVEQVIIDTHKQVYELRKDIDALFRLLVRR